MAKVLEADGHTVMFTCREKECTLGLARAYGLRYVSFGKPYKTTPGKLWGLLRFNLKMLRVLLRFRPDITLGHSSMYAAQASWLLGIPHISVEDTGNMEQVRLYRPFTKAILVPDSFHLNLGKKQVRYPGNHELAYLHPARLSACPPVRLSARPPVRLSARPPVRPSTCPPVRPSACPLVLLRFVAWNASHDKGHSGISDTSKRKAVAEFSRFGKVFISSEARLPDDLEPYRLTAPPEQLHDIMASASLVYGESATMASEAAVLGVPAIYLDNTGRCYTREEEEKYGLVFNFTESGEDQQKSILKGIELLSAPGILDEWQHRRQKMLNDKTDVTAFFAWFVENWPESFRIMKENPGKFTLSPS
ncbi:MAG: hypothetical protein NT040_02500 [Bacteroidetes bacterium]|nr:hypothetical protein [Bacteroidota bacterium]